MSDTPISSLAVLVGPLPAGTYLELATPDPTPTGPASATTDPKLTSHLGHSMGAITYTRRHDSHVDQRLSARNGLPIGTKMKSAVQRAASRGRRQKPQIS
jgi:hypothetical protein